MKKGGFMKRYTETIKLRVTPEMKTDLEMIAHHSGMSISEVIRYYLQTMIKKDGVPLPFSDTKSED